MDRAHSRVHVHFRRVSNTTLTTQNESKITDDVTTNAMMKHVRGKGKSGCLVGKKVLERTAKLNCATVAVWFYQENGRERRNRDDLCSIVAVGSYEHRGERKGEDEEEVQRGKEEERIGQVTLFRCSRGKSEEE